MQVLGREWRRGTVLVADGAWGTEFFKRGLMQGSPPDEWNLAHPDVVRDITREYLEAGADIVLTNTFGATRLRLDSHGLSARVQEINEAGVALAREVAGGAAIVAGDIGPTGRMLALGETSEAELYDSFAEQAAALARAGADWIVVESMTDVEEMGLAVRAAAREARLPVVASMTYARSPRGYRTMMGHDPAACVRRAEEEGASVIGANCGAGIEDYVPLAPMLRAATALPLWIKANAGVPEVRDGRVVYPLGAAAYASFVPRLLESGVDVVGGCCGTDPGFVRAIADAVGMGRRLAR